MTLTTRTRAKADAAGRPGAVWADSPAAVAAASDIVFTMLGYPSEVEEVVLGPGGVLDALAPGSMLVDMTTSRPALAVEIAARASDASASPRSTRRCRAATSARATARCRSWWAATPSRSPRVRPCFDAMGSDGRAPGPAGAGQHTKLVNQILVAGNIVAVCEALLYASRAGLDVRSVLASVSSGAAASWALSNLAPRIVDGDFAPGFFVDHFVKDMAIVLDEAARLQLALPGLALAHELYVALQAQGHGRDGTQSLILALEAMSPG